MPFTRTMRRALADEATRVQAAQLKQIKEGIQDLETHVVLTDEMVAGLALLRDAARRISDPYGDSLCPGWLPPVASAVADLCTAWGKRLQVEKNTVLAQIDAQKRIVAQVESGIVTV